MKFILLLLMLSFTIKGFSQPKSFIINGISFSTTNHSEKNEFDSKDYYINIFKIIKGKKIFLIKHYSYRYAADCNNVFKELGTLLIKNNTLILKTHYTQKGHDPIPEWEKKVYKVYRNGKVNLIYNTIFKNGKWHKVKEE